MIPLKPTRKTGLIAIGFGLFFIQSCSISRGTHLALISSSYDQQTNQTTYTIIPGGNMILPGNCVRGEYLSSSCQQFFKCDDGNSFSVTIAQKDKYEFFEDSLSDFQFTQAFYEWESNYFNENEIRVNDTLVDHSTTLIETDEKEGVIIWSLNLPNHSTVFFQFSKGPWFIAYSSTIEKAAVDDQVSSFREIYSLNRESSYTPKDSH